jgi:cell division protein FtsI/penicillin-binding protein 2
MPMMDTRGVRGAILIAAVTTFLIANWSCPAQAPPTWASAVTHAAHMAPEARIVVLDSGTGRPLASSHLADAARTLANPGSAMKPLVLYGLVAAGRWDPTRHIACTRKLTIAGHALNCSHPPVGPMDARQALAWSCNTYFATMAATLGAGQLRTLLAPTGLLGQTGLASGVAGGEATADFRDPKTPDENQLVVLGINGVRVTPLEFAMAYRWLAIQLAAHPDSAAAQVVGSGMEDSASFGMAGAADLGGVTVAGKTGTASNDIDGHGPTHGWFICMAPAKVARAIIVVYLPKGNGNDAAHVAAELLAHSPLRQLQP